MVFTGKILTTLAVALLVVGLVAGYYVGSLTVVPPAVPPVETITKTVTIAPGTVTITHVVTRLETVTRVETVTITQTPTPIPWPKTLSIATGGVGGVYYVIGGGIASLITKYIPGVEATAEVTAASVDNLKLIHGKKSDLATVMADIAYDSYMGIGAFEAIGKVDVKAVMALYTNYFHVVTLEGKGIEKLDDLKGKRVSTGAPGSGTEVKTLRVLAAAGIDPDKDLIRERLGVRESAEALKDGKIDAFFWSGGLPTAAIIDLATTPGIKIKLIPTAELLPKLTERFGPIYFEAVMPAGMYPGMDKDVKTLAVTNLLVCRSDLPPDLVYEIVKTILRYRDELIAIHKVAEEITLENAVKGSPIPFHEGAIRYFQERGVWKG